MATIQQVLNSAGYAVMLCCNEEDADKQDDQIKLLLDRMVDGLIIAPAGEDEIMKRLVTSTRKPVVLIDRVCDGLDIDAVILDNRRAVFDATTYLIGLGHRRIGYISGPPDTSTGRDRLAGYRDALAAAGVAFDENWCAKEISARPMVIERRCSCSRCPIARPRFSRPTI